MAESETGEIAPKIGPPDSGSAVVKQEEEKNESTGRAGLPERPRSRSPSDSNHPRSDKRKDSHGRQQGGARGRRKPLPPYGGRGPSGRPNRPSPGPPPLPPPGPPPVGYRRPDRLESPPLHRRGRSTEPLRRRTPPPPPPIAPSLPPPPSYRSRYNSPPRRSPPSSRRWSGPRSRSPPRGYRSPPGRRRRSPIRSPPPRRRSPPGMYRRSSRSPPYKRRPSPFSPRRSSPSRRSPPRTGNRTRSVSPQPIKHRLPSPGRSSIRPHLPPSVRSGASSRRGSPSTTQEHISNGYRSPRKRTRSPGQGDTSIKEEDDHMAKKRRTMDGGSGPGTSAGSPMQDVKTNAEKSPAPYHSEAVSENQPPTEPRSFRNSSQTTTPAVLRVKTELQDVEMSDGATAVSSPTGATPATPAAWKVPKGPAMKAPGTSAPSAGASQQPPTPVMTVPKMPAWKKDSVTPDLDAETERVRLLRLSIAGEHNNITTVVRRALYELELVEFDLRASESRLVVAQKQSELAARGMPIYIDDNIGQ